MQAQVTLARLRAIACLKYRQDSQLWRVICTTMNETPKKIFHDCEYCILCRGTFSVAKEKIRVFGKSNVCSLVYRATNVSSTVKSWSFVACSATIVLSD